MKSIFRTVALIAMVALMATSCKKQDENTEITVSFGDNYGFVEGPSIDGSRAYIDINHNGAFKWNQGDQIMVYNLSSTGDSQSAVYTSTSGNGATFAIFTGEDLGTPKDYGYFVFYNADKVQGSLDAENRQTFTVSDTQNYDPAYLIDPTSLVLACRDNGQVKNFTLQHIFGFLNIGIANNTNPNSDKYVTRIEVVDSLWKLAGEVSLKLHEVDDAEFTRLYNLCESTNGGDTYLAQLDTYLTQLGYNANGSSRMITLNCNNCKLPYRQWQYFFVSLRPGALYKGFTVTIYYSDGTNYAKTFGPNINYIIKPGWFRNIYFTTAQGFLQ